MENHHAIKNGKPSISMGLFNSFLYFYQRVNETLTIIVNIISPQFISPLTVVNDIPMCFPY